MTRVFGDRLPIDEILGDVGASLRARNNLVLVAPPGAGKTTRVPLALLDAPWRGDKKIILLEPRRLAARAAAARMAATLDEAVGETIGLRMRLESKISARTRVEVVTEGVFARMILDDPELSGVACVLFDEFHERSLDADLGLALALDAQGALREDLRLLVMSATLDGARVAALMGDRAPQGDARQNDGLPAPVIESAGRAFPVETRYLGRDPNIRVEEEVARAARRALAEEEGSILVFLPGQGEITRVAALLAERGLPANVDLAPLYGALDRAEQDRAIAKTPPGRRKIVLATSIAETSLTIDGVRIVIDCGFSRVPVFEPNLGLTRLETIRASRANVDQRRGRAGRVEPGVCYRLWEEAATGALPPFAAPEILAADLCGLVLDLAHWGVRDASTLAFLDPPPRAAWAEAASLDRDLGALDADGRLTPKGEAMRALPLPPRLASMVIEAASDGEAFRATLLAMLLSERGLGGTDADLSHRLERLRADRDKRAGDARRLAANWARQAEAATHPPLKGRVELQRSFPSLRRRAGGAGLSRPHRQGARRRRFHDGQRPRGLLAAGTRPRARNLSRRRGDRRTRRAGADSGGLRADARRGGATRRGPDRDARRNPVRSGQRRAASPPFPPPWRDPSRRAESLGRAHFGERARFGARNRGAWRGAAALDQGADAIARPRGFFARGRGGGMARSWRRRAGAKRRGLARALHHRPRESRRDRAVRSRRGAGEPLAL